MFLQNDNVLKNWTERHLLSVKVLGIGELRQRNTIPVKLGQDFVVGACINYFIPFQNWKIWGKVLNKLWNCLSARNDKGNNVQAHQAKRFRCYGHVVTVMGNIKIKIGKFRTNFITFLGNREKHALCNKIKQDSHMRSICKPRWRTRNVYQKTNIYQVLMVTYTWVLSWIIKMKESH